MKILYYSTSYYANHGGSIQSIEFFKCLDQFPQINEKFLYPESGREALFNTKGRNSLKNVLKKNSFIQIVSFLRRNRFNVKGLITKIESERPDVIFIQIDSNFLQISKIRKRFPKLIICTQINGSPFDEQFKNIAFKSFFLKLQKKSYLKADLNIFISDFSRENYDG